MSDTSEIFVTQRNFDTEEGYASSFLICFLTNQKISLNFLSILRDAAERQLIDLDALNMVFLALCRLSICMRDTMIPASMVVVGESDACRVAAVIVESGIGLVIGDDVDDIKIILHARICCLLLQENRQTFAMRDFIRPAQLILAKTQRLVAEFRANRNHMALVVDEYGQISGAVTIEDVLEQLLANEDEHDVDDSFADSSKPTVFTIKPTLRWKILMSTLVLR